MIGWHYSRIVVVLCFEFLMRFICIRRSCWVRPKAPHHQLVVSGSIFLRKSICGVCAGIKIKNRILQCHASKLEVQYY